MYYSILCIKVNEQTVNIMPFPETEITSQEEFFYKRVFTNMVPMCYNKSKYCVSI